MGKPKTKNELFLRSDLRFLKRQTRILKEEINYLFSLMRSHGWIKESILKEQMVIKDTLKKSDENE